MATKVIVPPTSFCVIPCVKDFSVKYFIQNGAPPSKLVLGMATYGRGFILDDVNNNGLYASASQPIPPGPITNTPGYWGYNEVKQQSIKESYCVLNVETNVIHSRFAPN